MKQNGPWGIQYTENRQIDITQLQSVAKAIIILPRDCEYRNIKKKT